MKIFSYGKNVLSEFFFYRQVPLKNETYFIKANLKLKQIVADRKKDQRCF